jgi:pimeloyl-ACP methyl ester carboxylesterase
MPGASVDYVLGRIPYVQIGNGSDPLFVITGGQGFVRRFDRDLFARDAGRTARMLPAGKSFLLLGYDPDPALNLSADMIAHQFATALLHFRDRPVDLIGISFGGLGAIRLAARHPERVRTLTLVASAHRFSSEGRRRVQHQIACAEREDWPALISGFAAVFRRPWLNALLRLRLWMSRNTLRRQMSTRSTILCYLIAIMEAQPVTLEAVKTPTLIVGGSEDQFFGEAMQEAD